MTKCKQLELYDKELFLQFLMSGKTLIDAAEAGDLETYKNTF